ncbi:protein cordon-bleu [Ctenodactylus gundi]
MDAPRVWAAKPPTGRKTKARAPPPPGKPAMTTVPGGQKPPRDAARGSQQSLSHVQEALHSSALDVTVVLPSGLEKQSAISGSHAMMDLLVDLCRQNHLNPSHHALEVRSADTQQPLSFKPNTLLGTLNVHTVFLKEKLPEEKGKPGPLKVPEKSVRLVVNYLRTQKAVVRVSPDVPLSSILPVICAKCEVSPEHVVLLRDNVAGEELQLSKSLNELGIKELYAWDNRREILRKSSLGNDDTDREKKKFLGFFKVNKRSNSKAKQLGVSGSESEEEAAEPASWRGENGCLTTPNSPLPPPRSLTLGPSLSLGSISGMSVKSDMKKRRAPPPPGAGPPGPDRASASASAEKMSLGSQVDLQRKKRRAPAPPPPQPPPPSPLVPNRREDKEENRKSTVGVGRQVPQKPPRGAARGPPQLVLPPPPPYPPPDPDEVEPLHPPREGAGSEASELRPKLSLPLAPSGPSSADGGPPAPLEAEETVSVGSCFASEDTTEDSGVMSSPSDIVSLDSQHDSSKSKDRWATDQEDYSDPDLAGTPELAPQESPLWETHGPRNSYPRAEEAAVPSNDEEDPCLVGQFQKTLAELDEDLEETEESYDTDGSSPRGSINGSPSHCVQDVRIPDSDADTIPVTFIGEVSDDPVDTGQFSNRNNNASSFDTKAVASRSVHVPSSEAAPSHPQGSGRGQALGPYSPSWDRSNGVQAALPQVCPNGNSAETQPTVTSVAVKLLPTDPLKAKERGRVHGSASGEKTQVSWSVRSQYTKEKEASDKSSVSAPPPPWCQRGQVSGASYGLKYGLPTYKIVPPKSEMRCYDREVSLATGAIKIDELGNLVNPYQNSRRTVSMPSPTVGTETQPLGKVKDFWRFSSMERNPTQPTEEGSTKRTSTALSPVSTATTSIMTSEKSQQDGRLKAAPVPAASQQPPTPQEHGAALEEGRSWPRSAVTNHIKVAPTNSSEVPFLKPQRRTSSQYVASAIARRMGPPKVHTDVVRQPNHIEKGREGRSSRLLEQPLAMKGAATPGQYSEAQGHSQDASQPSIYVSRSTGGQSATRAHPGWDRKSSGQDCPVNAHRSSCLPPTQASQTDYVSVGQSCGFKEKQNTSDQKASSASDPRHTLNGAYPPPAHVAGAHSPGRTLVSGKESAAAYSEPLSSSILSQTKSHIILETEEKPSMSPMDRGDTDGAFSPSIFGPKKKFRPVTQRPVPKDTSLHSALMEAIHSAGGKDRLRKIAEPPSEGGLKGPSYTEAESERSALLAAIRGHRGTHSLRKVTSLASEELRSLRDADATSPGPGHPQLGGLSCPSPLSPVPPAPPASSPAPGNPGDARQALLDAIRSGSGAARLRKMGLDNLSAGPGHFLQVRHSHGCWHERKQMWVTVLSSAGALRKEGTWDAVQKRHARTEG